MSEHIYTIVVADPAKRGFDTTADVVRNGLIDFDVLWLSNIYAGEERDVESPDFDLTVRSHGRELEAFFADSPEDRGELSTEDLVDSARSTRAGAMTQQTTIGGTVDSILSVLREVVEQGDFRSLSWEDLREIERLALQVADIADASAIEAAGREEGV